MNTFSKKKIFYYWRVKLIKINKKKKVKELC